MTAFIIILILGVLLYFLFFNKNESVEEIWDNHKVDQSANMISIQKQEIFTDGNGRQYVLQNKTREIPRRTFIKANLTGKYWGIINNEQSEKFIDSDFFDFNIYEIRLINALYSDVPFQINGDKNFKREKLPKFLPTAFQSNGNEYNINLHEPIVANVKFNRKLHQNEGNEVFGTIEGEITGYVLDFLSEPYTEKRYLDLKTPSLTQNTYPLNKTTVPTGNFELKNGYKRIEFYNSDYKTTYLGNWEHQKTSTKSSAYGCLGSFYSVLLVSLFIFGIINAFERPRGTNNSQKKLSVSSRKRNTPSPTSTPPKEDVKSKDTIISHILTWQDYEGNSYNGKFWVRNRDYKQAKEYKNSLSLEGSQDGYERIIYLLKENDKQKLEGLYQMFDKISLNQKYSKLKFAEIIVSFVQHIQYAAVLPLDCNPTSYQDDFLQKYLSSPEARCDSFEKFGINTPVEFMANLNGDCDTRTLLLYTILSHYKYDVSLMSSDYYRHSLLGINLPIEGIAYAYQNQKYILWETTSKNNKPGVIPNEISNLNYWKISLKSK